jgi:hypothetical protein
MGESSLSGDSRRTVHTVIWSGKASLTGIILFLCIVKGKGKGLPQQAGVAQGVPSRLRSRIFLTFGTTRVVGRQPYAATVFTPREIPGIHF